MLQDLKLPRIIAHRGACAYAPENTLVSMRKAHALGAKWVEFDVMLTADGEAIIMHDETLARTTNGGKRQVAQTSYSDIAKLDAGSWFANQYAHEPVPTLVELLELLKQLKLNINLEIKPTPGKEVETTEKSLALIKQHWPIVEYPPMISSQSEICLRTVHQLAPEYCLGLVIHHWNEPWEFWLREYACQSVSVNHRILSQKKIEELKQLVKYILAYTVNDQWDAMELFESGVDAVFSDKTDLLEGYSEAF
jgi:glycerophosphoryl diester phosphodiesterase